MSSPNDWDAWDAYENTAGVARCINYQNVLHRVCLILCNKTHDDDGDDDDDDDNDDDDNDDDDDDDDDDYDAMTMTMTTTTTMTMTMMTMTSMLYCSHKQQFLLKLLWSQQSKYRVV